MAATDQFPGFKLITVPGKGFRIECRQDGCYEARPSGWRRSAAILPTLPEIRSWVDQHEHHTLAEAKAECVRMARERRAEAAAGNPDLEWLEENRP